MKTVKAASIVIIKFDPGPYWRVGVKCQCGAVGSYPFAPSVVDVGPILVYCHKCGDIVEFNLEGMKPGDIKNE